MTRDDIPLSTLSRLRGPLPPRGFTGDGCSCAPDRWPPCTKQYDLRPACLFHDWAYRRGGDRRARQRADADFYRNLQACGMGPFWAGVYYRRVRLWGLRHFRWAPGQRPHGLWIWIGNFLGRYLMPVPSK